eukprot:scaffold6433_cov125-Cylindrotheca_fusiformis.AAC.4
MDRPKSSATHIESMCLALLLPNATVFVVDLRKRSLNLMHEKADLVVEEIRQNETTKSDPLTAPIRFDKNNRAFSCCGRDGILSNLHSFHGPVEAFKENFDLAIALHLCGEATDVALRLAGSVNAAGVVVAPCCVGKLSTKAMNPDVYNATGSNEATVTYPQSSFFRGIITDQEDWDALAKAADYNSETGSKTHNSAPRRTAKALIETDRRMFLEELYRYSTVLMRMDPWDLTPKNDILVAWNPLLIDTEDLPHPKPDMKCSKDIEVTKAQFLVPGDNLGQSEWTKGEETEIVESIQDFLDRTRGTKQEFDPFIFPTPIIAIANGRAQKKVGPFCSKQTETFPLVRGIKGGGQDCCRGKDGQWAVKAVIDSIEDVS